MPYDQSTGAGSVGVEFAGTAVSSTGFGGTIGSANKKSAGLVQDNRELQWSEGYYRGYYELHITPSEITANYYGTHLFSLPILPLSTSFGAKLMIAGCPTVSFRNPLEISLANFTVKAGDNHLQRSVANGTVETGALQRGSVKQTNVTLNTETGMWNVTAFDQVFIQY